MTEERLEEERVDAALAETSPETSTAWLEPIYRSHATSVLHAAYRITGNADDAEDVLQTVFERLARRSDPPDLGHNPLPYLKRAATNAALDIVTSRHARSNSPLAKVPDGAIVDSSPAPDRRHMSVELRDLIRDALGQLSRRHAEMFVLRYFEGLDNQTIALQMDTSAGTVAVTLHRVRSRLIDQLAPYLGGSQ